MYVAACLHSTFYIVYTVRTKKAVEWRLGMRPSAPAHPTHLWVSMLLDVHLSEGADVPNPRDLDGEVAEEVDDIGGPVPQVEEEDEGGDKRTEELVDHVHLEGGRKRRGRREGEGREKGGRREGEGREKGGRREREGREKGGRREREGREKGERREGEGREKGGRREGEGREKSRRPKLSV